MKRFHSLILSLLWLGGSYPLLVSATRPLFNVRLLELDRPIEVDISQFNRPDNLPEGEYQVDIYVNDRFIARRAVRFFRHDPESALAPCFVDVKNTLAMFGLKVNAIKALDTVNAEGCEPVPVLPGAKWTLDSEKLALKASIPQVYLDATARDAISPSRWDQGIDALMLNYDFSTTQTLKSDYDSDDLYYLNLRSGLNIGGWRLRNYSALNAVNSRGNVRSLSTYLQHDIASLRSQAMAGDTWTASDLFDSSQVRGVRLYTDSDMLPDSQNGFAPVVRGVAKTNAVVTIRQNGYMIYQSAVPQGPFALTDLNTTSSGGDLDVSIKEEDGSEQHFVQPYASLAILRREGQTDVDISIGERRDNDRFMPEVMQAQVLHGMAWGMTLYGGTQLADDYRAFAAGIGKDLGNIGAISMDITHAQSHFTDDDEQGQSWRFLYSKTFDVSNTSLRIVGYRYSTEGFYTLGEWASRTGDSENFWHTGNRRSRVEGTWTQPFSEGYGNVYLTLSREQFWRTDDVQRLIQIGYSNSWKQVVWNLSWNYTDTVSDSMGEWQQEDESEHLVMLSLSLPLSAWLPNSYVNYNYAHSNHGTPSHQIGLNGNLLDDNNLSWNIQQSVYENRGTSAGNAGLVWDASYGSLKTNYAWSDESQSLNYGVSGGVLIHDEGITFSQEMGETVALIKAPGAAGLSVDNASGVATDWRGYTVKTQLSPYDENRIALQNKDFVSGNVELERSVQNLVPTRGAVVKAEFVTHIGYRVLFSVSLANGKPAPFGAVGTAALDVGSATGIVGDKGELYLAGMPESGQFSLTLSSGKVCLADYHIHQKPDSGLVQLPVICR